MDTIGALLSFIYGGEKGKTASLRLSRIMRRYEKRIRRPRGAVGGFSAVLSQKDAFLIAYGDHFSNRGAVPLSCLHRFLTRFAAGAFSGVHILPFFPSSSDEGFSVMDYRSVDPRLGTWRDVSRIAGDFRLMVDLVLNHASTQGRWFRGFLKGSPRYAGYFITPEENADLSRVFRPRTHPLLTPFHSSRGEIRVWTTFSADQADLDYANPSVLLEMVDVLLGYIVQGAQVLRLDAVAFLWKESGTSCVHLPRTHAVVRLLRAIMDALCPWVMIVTETNVPHEQNISYLGNGSNEAHMVYNFTLPPLILDAFRRGDAGPLRAWASSLKQPPGATAFLNFLSSHDGIGLVPAKDFLTEEQVEGLVRMTRERGGMVSYRFDAAACAEKESPYELNATWLDAISDPGEEEGLRLRKYITSHCIMLSLAGVPAVWANSLIGAPADPGRALQTGNKRAVNRRKFSLEEVEKSLASEGGLQVRVYGGLASCMRARSSRPAFHPQGSQEVLPTDGPLFCLLRTSPDKRDSVLCIHNTGPKRSTLVLEKAALPTILHGPLQDLLGAPPINGTSVSMDPYQTLWLAGKKPM